MNDRLLSRRNLLALGSTAAVAATVPSRGADEQEGGSTEEGFRYCLNTSCIRGDGLGIVEKAEIAARAGYDAIEPWVREIETYEKANGSLKKLQRRIADLGLTVESAIGFARWIVDDEEERKAGLEQAERDMEAVAKIGGTRIAAPPVGATKERVDPLVAAERYAALLEVGDRTGVVPQLEVWGFSASLSRLGESALAAIESGHPKACLLPDVYHVYKGGSDFDGLKLLSGSAMHVFHVNDYPADPPRAEINDAARVYPGDGVAPLAGILRTLHANGFRGHLSLELFNREYWKQEPQRVAETGLRKMRAEVERALGS